MPLPAYPEPVIGSGYYGKDGRWTTYDEPDVRVVVRCDGDTFAWDPQAQAWVNQDTMLLRWPENLEIAIHEWRGLSLLAIRPAWYARPHKHRPAHDDDDEEGES